MRLAEIDRGDSLPHRLLIAFISAMSGMRLPDAARVAFYHRDFFSAPLGAWTQAAMRGPSPWSVGERELMAAMVAKWNSNNFCVGAHGAIAAQAMPRAAVDAAVNGTGTAALSPALVATLGFLEKLTRRPEDVSADDARAVLDAGVTEPALIDAVAVATLFNIVTRYADALDFAIPTAKEFDKAGRMLLKRGYG